MADIKQDARSRFLEATARLYAKSSPPTSAYLMQVWLNGAADTARDVTNPYQGLACAGCFTLLEPGKNTRTVIEHNVTSNPLPNLLPNHPRNQPCEVRNGSKVQCQICHRVFQTLSETPKAKSLRSNDHPNKRRNETASRKADLNPSFDVVMVNQSRSRRQKVRKQGGLQAILERSKQASTMKRDSVLDLMDFMKQS